MWARNPYIAGKAIGSDRDFCGREDILRAVLEVLSSPQQAAIVLAGQRRIGKSSILLQLQRSLPANQFCPVYFDLMDRAEEPLGQLLRDLTSAISGAAGLVPPVEHYGDDGAEFKEQFLPQLYSKLGEERRPILLLDEFDVLDSATQRRLNQNVAAVKLFPYLRRLIEIDGRIGFVFVVGRKPDELSIQFKSAFKSAVFKRVSVLPADDARRLILRAQSEGTLRFEDDAVDRVLSLTGGHPLFTQLMGHILWDRAHGQSSENTPEVSAATVDAVVDLVLEAAENVFQWIWDGLPPAERIITAASARATESHGIVSEEDLLVTLQGHGIRILTRELNLAPETLVDWEILKREGSGFRFAVELMRMWIQSRKPLPKVKSELDRIVQPADEIFRSAEVIYRQGDHAGVEELLQQTLRINPNHVNARLLLGTLFLEEDRIAQAVTILDQAYEYDEDNARYLLVRALIAQGAHQEAAGQEDQAIATYDRILAISPKERNAGERRIAILISRGERNLQRGDYAKAQEAFAAAGITERVEEVATAQRHRRIEELSREATALSESEDFPSRTRILNQLHSLEPENQNWSDELAKVSRQRTLYERYEDGISAYSSGDLATAVASFSEVIQLQPDYRDAAKKLAKAVQKRRSFSSRRSITKAWYVAGAAILTTILLLGLLAGFVIWNNNRPPETTIDLSWQATVSATMVEQPNTAPAKPDLELDTGPAIACFVAGSHFLLTGGQDGVVHLWDLQSEKSIIQRTHKKPIRSLAVSRKGDRFLTLADDNTVRLFKVTQIANPAAFEFAAIPLPGPIVKAALTADGTLGAALDEYDNSLFLFDANTGATVNKSHAYVTPEIYLDFNPNGNILGLINPYLDVDFYAVPGLTRLDLLNDVAAERIKWAPNGSVVALGGGYRDRTKLAIWNVNNTRPHDVVNTQQEASAFAFSPDMKFFAVGTEDALLVFDLLTRQQVLRAPVGPVLSVDFNEQNSRVAVGCSDGKTRVFTIRFAAENKNK